jgi:UDP-N-acetylglucosamine--N-acetylmuramyl-(pentapeptide) pyrophosphoryl-undecaprenol N-acetylglucosamine transferase
VPSPNVAEDHQTKNAAAFVEKGAAIMVKDAEARQKLVPELIKLLESDDQQVKMRINLKKLAVPNSDE